MPPAMAAAVESFMAAQLTDEGTPEASVPSRRAALLGYRGQVHKNILKLTWALDERGLVDRKGKLRVAWLSTLMGLMDRACRLDSLLGLTRTPKQIPQSPREWLEAQALADAQPITQSDGQDESIGKRHE